MVTFLTKTDIILTKKDSTNMEVDMTKMVIILSLKILNKKKYNKINQLSKLSNQLSFNKKNNLFKEVLQTF